MLTRSLLASVLFVFAAACSSDDTNAGDAGPVNDAPPTPDGPALDGDPAPDSTTPPADGEPTKDDATTKPVDGEWTAVGPALASPGLGNSLTVAGETIHASVQNMSSVSVQVLDSFAGDWTKVPDLAIPSKKTSVPMVAHKGAVIVGMPFGIDSADTKIYVKATGAAKFEAKPIGLTNNKGGIAHLWSNGSTIYGLAYKGLMNETFVVSEDDGATWTLGDQDAITLTGGTQKGFASGSRNFFFGDGALHYCDAGGQDCTQIDVNTVRGAYAGAGDGKNVVVHTGDNGTSIAYSADNGETWNEVKAIKVATTSSSMAFANGCFFNVNKGGAMRSCDGGATWDDITKGLPKISAFVQNPAAMLVADGGFIYGFFGAQVFRYPTK